MNIGQILKSVLGDIRTTEAKTLELRVGQIVSGVILQLMSEQDALVNIGGVQVRARLEIPLKQGQATLLQVQPESVNGQIILKPLSQSNVRIDEESFPQLLKEFALKDEPIIRQVVQQLQQSGAVLEKRTIQSLAAITAEIPEHVQSEQWVQSAVICLQRGLPLTKETVQALDRTLFGPPLHQTLNEVQHGVQTLLQNTARPLSDQIVRLSDRLLDLLQQLRSISLQQTNALSSGRLSPSLTVGTETAAYPQSTSANAFSSVPASPPQTVQPEMPTPFPRLPSANAEPPANASRGLRQSTEMQQSTQNRQTELPPTNFSGQPQSVPHSIAAEAANDDSFGQAEGAAANRFSADPKTEGTWLLRLLQTLGVDHESRLSALPDPHALTVQDPPAGSDLSGDEGIVQRNALNESVKSVLLQLAAQEMPSALKEQVQQAVQQITGQQLMLASDRSLPFTQVTFYLPMYNAQGAQTASVHIQSQKKKGGRLDSHNCRLWFDLKMNTLGETVVDAHIVDKTVNLTVCNDHPFISGLLNDYREEIEKSLSGIGYRLFSLKSAPFVNVLEESSFNRISEGGSAAFYRKNRYKGVDIRI